MKKQKLPIVLLVIVGVLLMIIAFLIVRLCDNNSTIFQSSETTQPLPVVEKNPDSIAIPGYEILELKSDSTQQTLCLPNPEQNVCYFQIALYLEDGTLLWQSELVAPGDISEPISLIKPLDKGAYPNAILKYGCFKLDGITPF